MIRSPGWCILVLAVSTSTATAADEVPLDKLKPEHIRARLKEAFEGPGTKQTIDKLLKVPGVMFTVTPDEIEYSYVGGKPKLIWRYRSPAPLDPDQQTKVAAALRTVLVESLVQLKVDGKGLVSGEDFALLAEGFEPLPALTVPNVPPPQDLAKELANLHNAIAQLSLLLGQQNKQLPDNVSQLRQELKDLQKKVERLTKAGEEAATSKPTSVTHAVVYYYAAPGYWGDPYCGCSYWAVPVVYYYQVPVVSSPSPSLRAERDYQAHFTPTLPARQESQQSQTLSTVRRQPNLKNLGPKDVPGLYSRAVTAFGKEDYEEALDLLSVVVLLDGYDARSWYYKALTERTLGRGEAAQQSACRGAALELLGRADPTQTLSALEALQGTERQFLREFLDLSMTRERAKRIINEPTADSLGTEMAAR